MRTAVLAICCCLSVLSLEGQELGLRASHVKFFKIETDVATVIFTEDHKHAAQRVADIIQHMSEVYPLADGKLYRKIPILLQDKTDITNGYVGLGPWRSEFYLSPPVRSFNLGSLPWSELLAVHEFRHVQQVSAARTGLTRLISTLFGQEAYGGMKNLAWPDWYSEGDAVISETVLSAQGRGRLPAFLNGYRAKLVAGPAWPYEKARNGSYREWIPSHYHLGFLLQNYGRTRFGQAMWDSVATESAAYQGLIYPFSNGLRRHTGMGTEAFYHAAMDHYRDLWTAPEETASQGTPVIEQHSDRYTDYRYPVFTHDGDLYASMETFDKTAAIYRITPEGPEKVISLGYTHEGAFSYGNGKFCWAEQRVHPRWVREDHTVLVVFDISTGRRSSITGKASYFTPSFSPDGKHLAAICDVDDMQTFELQILDVRDGTQVGRFDNDGLSHLSFPTWVPDGSTIICAARDDRGRMALVKYEMDSDTPEPLTPWSYRPIGRPAVHGEWVYFTKSGEFTDQVCRVSISAGDIQTLTGGSASHYAPAVDPVHNRLVTTMFTLQGHQLVSFALDSLQPMADVVSGPSPTYLHTEDKEHDILATAPARTYEVDKYPRLGHPIYLHSWNVFEDDPVYGLELLSENVLSSVLWRSGFQYNTNDDSYGPFSQLTFGTFFPELLVNYTGWRLKDEDVDWYHVIGGGIRIPLQGLSGPYNMAAAFTTRINRLWTTGDLSITRNYLSYDLAFINRRRLAVQHPMTRFGQAVRLHLVNGIDGEMANQFQAQTDFTTPSPLRNHVLWLQLDYRRELLSNAFLFSDRFDYARGYNAIRSDNMVRIGANYHFPVAYPDFGIAGIVYFKRLRLNAFYDWSRASQVNEDISVNFRSVGLEVMLDLKIFNVELVEIGLRWSHLLDDDLTDTALRNRFGFFVPVERI